VPITDDAAALELAHATCTLLNEGGTTNAALKTIDKAEKKWSDQQVLNFGGLAVYAYCREHLPEQAQPGAGMAANLLEAGHEVTVYNGSQDKAAARPCRSWRRTKPAVLNVACNVAQQLVVSKRYVVVGAANVRTQHSEFTP
jgi:Protein of unknown function (DUF732)